MLNIFYINVLPSINCDLKSFGDHIVKSVFFFFKCRVLKVVRHPPSYKIPWLNFYSAILKSSYVSIWFKMSKRTAKIIYNETFKETIVQLQAKCSFVSLCLSPDFSPAQQTWLSAIFGKLSFFKLREWGFLDPYKQVLSFCYLYLERYTIRRGE